MTTDILRFLLLMDPARLEAGDLRLFVHGVETNLTVLAGGSVLASIPVFLDEEGSIAPVPAQPVGFELYAGEELVGEASSAFTVETLPEAPGAADRVVELLSGENEQSLPSRLEGLERGTDGALEFVEGILAGSGLLARMEEVAERVDVGTGSR